MTLSGRKLSLARKGKLHLAVERGDLHETKKLLQSGYPANVQYGEGIQPIDLAVESGNLDALILLLGHGASLLRSFTNLGGSALHRAARRGHTEMVGYLLEKELEVNGRDSASNTPLHEAASGFGTYTAATLLLAAGAHIDATNKNGTTPLLEAVQNSNLAVVALLVGKGARKDLRDIDGYDAEETAHFQIEGLPRDHIGMILVSSAIQYHELVDIRRLCST